MASASVAQAGANRLCDARRNDAVTLCRSPATLRLCRVKLLRIPASPACRDSRHARQGAR
jgi:hypothetical protein